MTKNVQTFLACALLICVPRLSGCGLDEGEKIDLRIPSSHLESSMPGLDARPPELVSWDIGCSPLVVSEQSSGHHLEGSGNFIFPGDSDTVTTEWLIRSCSQRPDPLRQREVIFAIDASQAMAEADPIVDGSCQRLEWLSEALEGLAAESSMAAAMAQTSYRPRFTMMSWSQGGQDRLAGFVDQPVLLLDQFAKMSSSQSLVERVCAGHQAVSVDALQETVDWYKSNFARRHAEIYLVIIGNRQVLSWQVEDQPILAAMGASILYVDLHQSDVGSEEGQGSQEITESASEDALKWWQGALTEDAFGEPLYLDWQQARGQQLASGALAGLLDDSGRWSFHWRPLLASDQDGSLWQQIAIGAHQPLYQRMDIRRSQGQIGLEWKLVYQARFETQPRPYRGQWLFR